MTRLCIPGPPTKKSRSQVSYDAVKIEYREIHGAGVSWSFVIACVLFTSFPFISEEKMGYESGERVDKQPDKAELLARKSWSAHWKNSNSRPSTTQACFAENGFIRRVCRIWQAVCDDVLRM